MKSKTSVRKPKTQSPKPNSKSKKAALDRCTFLQILEIPVDDIVASPYQPRQSFDPDELARLGQQIREQGLLDALWVRPLGNGSYELLDGERRWRAAIAEGLLQIRCDVYECSDAQARRIGLITVLNRVDLNAIERACQFQKILDAGDYAGQKELAAAMGLDQSTVSNLLRLLKLPESWQQRIISREMSERHARALLPYLHYPLIMTAAETYCDACLVANDGGGMPSVIEWEEHVLPGIVKDSTRSMDGIYGDRTMYHPRWGQVTIFEPDVIEEKKLAIINLGDEQLATNVELWEELQEAHLKEIANRKTDQEAPTDAAVSADRDETVDVWGRPQAEELAGKLLDVYDRYIAQKIKLARPAVEFCQEIQQVGYVGLLDDLSRDRALDIVEEHAAAAIAETDGTAGSTAKSVETKSDNRQPTTDNSSDFYRWRLAWQRKLIAEALTTASLSDLVKILTLGLCSWKIPHEGLEQLLDEALRDKADPSRRKSMAANLFDCADFHLEEVLAFVAADWFYHPDRGPSGDVPAEDVELLITQLEIDLTNEWDQANILALRALLDLYDVKGLMGLAKRWKVTVDGAWGHDGIAAKLEHAVGDEEIATPIPVEVLKAKR